MYYPNGLVLPWSRMVSRMVAQLKSQVIKLGKIKKPKLLRNKLAVFNKAKKLLYS